MSLSIVYMGTPKFAIPALEALNEKYEVKAVVTATDKPQGRGHKVLPSDVKLKALELGIPVLQPEKLKDEEFIAEIKKINPDIIVVVAFRVLPKEVYSLAKLASFNIHGSLLPQYRGAAPINWAIINGDKFTGLTSFLLQDKVDTGDVLLQSIAPIPDGATAGDLHDLLAPLSAKLAVDTCELIASGSYRPIPQSDSEASLAPKIFQQTAQIDFSMNAEQVRNFIHGFSPAPGAWTIWNGKLLKILRASFQYCQCDLPESIKKLDKPTQYYVGKDKFAVRCTYGIIFIEELQVEGKKPMKAIDFLRGYKGEPYGEFERKELINK